MPERNDAPCPACTKRMGDHTIDGLDECLQGFNYHLPYEDIPDGPLQMDMGEMVSEVTVASAFIDSPVGRFPCLQFRFYGAGSTPMEHRPLPPITLVMDANTLKNVRQLVSTAVDRAILAARRGR